MTAVVNPEPRDMVPLHCLYSFPPFPRPPPGGGPLSFNDFSPHGLILQAGPSRLAQSSPHSDNALEVLKLLDVASEFDQVSEGGRPDHQARQRSAPTYTTNRDGLATIRPCDAWLIGDPLARWEEPACSSISSYDL